MSRIPATNGDPMIALRGVSKVYRRGDQIVNALDGVDLSLPERGMAAIVGPSGSGKSSLLHLMGAMDRPTAGEVYVAGQLLNTLPESGLTAFRCNTVGFVFQSFNLIPNLSAIENVMLPMEFAGVASDERKRRAANLLEQVNLSGRSTHRPRELSGGEQQRVAIARALANNPRLVLADEPTGNLDSKTGRLIYELLKEIATKRTVVVVTHAEALAELADQVLHIGDGKLVAGNAQSALPEDASAERRTNHA